MPKSAEELDRWVRSLPRAELHLVALCLERGDLMGAAARTVRGSDLTDPFLRDIFESLLTLDADRSIEQTHAALVRMRPHDPETLDKIETLTWDGFNTSEGHRIPISRMSLDHYAGIVVEQAAARCREFIIKARAFDETELEKLLDFERRMQGLEGGTGYHDMGVTGAALLEASSQPVPQPVISGLLWPGHVNVLAGQTKIGKTFLVMHALISIALGRSPWTLVESMPQGRVLMLSRDDTSRELAQRLRHLEAQNTGWADHIVVVGKDKIPARLDDRGLAMIRTTLDVAAQAYQPFSGVVVDPYHLFLPQGMRLNDDESAVQVIGGLEEICTRWEIWAWVIHHLRKRMGSRREREDLSDDDLLDEVKGAGVTNVARAVAILTKTEEHLRRIVAWSNLGPPPKPLVLEVCDQGKTSIDRWRPATFTGTPVHELMGVGHPFSFTEYGRRLLGMIPGSKLGPKQRQALWPAFQQLLDEGLVQVLEVAGSRKMYEAISPSESPKSECDPMRPDPVSCQGELYTDEGEGGGVSEEETPGDPTRPPQVSGQETRGAGGPPLLGRGASRQTAPLVRGRTNPLRPQHVAVTPEKPDDLPY